MSKADKKRRGKGGRHLSAVPQMSGADLAAIAVTAATVRDAVADGLDLDGLDGDTARRPGSARVAARLRAERRGRMRYRLRRQARPHYLLAALLAAAGAARVCVHLLGDVGAVAATVGVLAAFTAGVGVLVVRKHVARPHHRWATLCLLAAAGWLTATTGVGITWETTAVLLVGGYGLALRWWARHRIPNSRAERLVEVDEVDTEAIPHLWAANVGDKSGPLPGSLLTDHTATRHGEAFTVQLRPGRQSRGSILAGLPLVASGLRRDVADLVVDRHPSGDSSRAVVQVITRSPIRDTIPFTGPAYDPGTGAIAIGPFADGEADACWQLYTEHSMWGGVIIGSTGSGKSRLTEGLAISAIGSGCTVVCYADPQHGASSPALARHAHWAALEDAEILDMLRAAEAVVRWRAKENAAHGWEGFTPAPDRPGIMLIVDECHKVFAREEPRVLAGWIGREGRKTGVVLVPASQYPGLETFGGSEALRSSVMTRNAVVLRTTSKTTKGIMAGLVVDPADLPPLPGYGYLIDTSDTGRTAPFRARYVDEHDRDRWLTELPQVGFDPVAAHAAGPAYTSRVERAEANRAALLAELDALRNGQPLPTRARRRRPTAASAGDPATGGAATPSGSAQPSDTAGFGDAGFGDVVAFPAALNPEPDPALAETVEDASALGGQAAGLGESHAAVLAAIRSGRTSPKAVREATGWGETYVRRLLGELVDTGRITRVGTGTYAVAGAPTRDTNTAGTAAGADTTDRSA